MTATESREPALPVSARNPGVLIVGPFLSASTGIRFVCEDLAEGLAGRGWPVTTTSAIPGRGRRLADMLTTVSLKRRAYEVAQVEVYSGPAFAWALAVAGCLKALRCPFVLTLHDGALPDFAHRRPFLAGNLLRAARAVTCPSAYLAESFAHVRPDIEIIPNGIHIDRYPPRIIDRPRPRLVWVRAFERHYNPLLALEVVQRLLPRFPDVQLLMAGPDRGDWTAEQTREHARLLGLEHCVRIQGAVTKDEVPATLRAGDILLNTTDVDNAPVILLEAMASGLCVVSTDAGGVPKLVEDERDALLVGRNDPDAMAGAVTRVLLDPWLAKALSVNGRKRAESHAWQLVLDRWEDLLASLAGPRRL